MGIEIRQHAPGRDMADFIRVGALTDNPLASMTGVLVVSQLPCFREDLHEPLGRTARRIFFQPMMHLHDFQIEGRTEDFGRLLRQPKERIHSHAVVGREDDWDRR